MAYFPPQFQIVSDLHLETPLLRPSYSKYTQEIEARHLCLLGDIGLVKDDGLFHFLETLLKKTPNLIILYVLGNHESYQMTLAAGKQKLRDFEEKITKEYPGSPRFVFLDRKRCDINNRVSVLGCTLWSRILPEQMQRVSTALTDFNERNGIREWTPSDHLEEHRKDLAWLNDQVQRIEKEEPERQIVIFTHHSPTVDSRANNPRHVGSPFSSGFVTDLLGEEEGSGKLVVANQKGYSRIGDVGVGMGAGASSSMNVVMEAGDPCWEVLSTTDEKMFREKKGKEAKPQVEEVPAWTKDLRLPSERDINVY